MIVSASRRTDIPAFYSKWFINRLQEEYVMVQNPRNPKRISRVTLNKDVVDCIVFWTKNPIPMIDKLDIIENMKYPFYFQFTLTPYGAKVEKELPTKRELLETFKTLSNIIGSHRIVWRYDPIIINDKYTISYHLKVFKEMAERLSWYTNHCVISFLDLYSKVRNRMKTIANREICDSDIVMQL